MTRRTGSAVLILVAIAVSAVLFHVGHTPAPLDLSAPATGSTGTAARRVIASYAIFIVAVVSLASVGSLARPAHSAQRITTQASISMVAIGIVAGAAAFLSAGF